MTVEEFVSLIEGRSGYKRKKAGKDWLVRCPAHDDHDPSLSVGLADSGKHPVLKCYTGCDFNSILRAADIHPKDFYGEDDDKKFEIEAIYKWKDEDGTLLFETVRGNFWGRRGKAIPRRKADDGKWAWSLTASEHYLDSNGDWRKVNGKPHEQGKQKKFIPAIEKKVIYNLPQILKRKNDLIVIVGGEKDADNLIKYGILATTNPSGEGNWNDSFNKWFKDRRVVILPDNDEAGLNFAKRIKNSLYGTASSVQVIELEGLQQKGDFSDWIHEHTIEELLDLIYGVNLPSAQLAEKAVLGAIFKKNRLINQVIEHTAARTFYFEANRNVLNAMISCVNKNMTIDKITVGQELGDKLLPSGGYDYVEELIENGQVMDTVESYLRLIADKWEARELLKVADQVKHEVPSTKDIQGLKNRISGQLAKVIPQKKKAESANAIAVDFLQNFDKRAKGILTGFRDFDALTNGLQKNNLIVVAARAKQGKTTFTLNIADNVASQGLNVLYFSMEMSKQEMIKKILAARAHVNVRNLINGELTPEELIRIHSVYEQIPKSLYIDDTAGLNYLEVRAKFRSHTEEYGKPDLVLIDYLQKMKSAKPNASTYDRVSEISGELKNIAMDEEIPLIALSQLSRAPNSRNDKRPMDSDLRESGSIEQDLDLLAFIYRDEVYDPKPENKGLAELIVSGRNVEPGTIDLAFLGQYSKFENLIKA